MERLKAKFIRINCAEALNAEPLPGSEVGDETSGRREQLHVTAGDRSELGSTIRRVTRIDE
jgi:hypothetical protein